MRVCVCMSVRPSVHLFEKNYLPHPCTWGFEIFQFFGLRRMYFITFNYYLAIYIYWTLIERRITFLSWEGGSEIEGRIIYK